MQKLVVCGHYVKQCCTLDAMQCGQDIIPLRPFTCVESHSRLSSSSGMVEPGPTSCPSGFEVPKGASTVLPFHGNNGSAKIFKLNHGNGFVKMSAGFSIPGMCSKCNPTSSNSLTNAMAGQSVPTLSKHQVDERM